jgi:hypothetical protein
MYTVPTDTRVKKMFPTRLVHDFSILENGTASRMRHRIGRGKKIHIIWLCAMQSKEKVLVRRTQWNVKPKLLALSHPHVIIEPIVAFCICSKFIGEFNEFQINKADQEGSEEEGHDFTLFWQLLSFIRLAFPPGCFYRKRRATKDSRERTRYVPSLISCRSSITADHRSQITAHQP